MVRQRVRPTAGASPAPPLIEWYSERANSGLENRTDLEAAQRRRVQALVGRTRLD